MLGRKFSIRRLIHAVLLCGLLMLVMCFSRWNFQGVKYTLIRIERELDSGDVEEFDFDDFTRHVYLITNVMFFKQHKCIYSFILQGMKLFNKINNNKNNSISTSV